MSVCDAKYRICNYAPAATGPGTGTWTITSTETSNVTQHIMYIDAVDVQANHGSFTTLTLNGSDFTGSFNNLNVKTQFMSSITTPSNLTIFTSEVQVPTLSITGGVLSLTTVNGTNINSTNIVGTNISSSLPPSMTYTTAPNLTSSMIGYTIGYYTASTITLGTSATSYMTSTTNIGIGGWMISFAGLCLVAANSASPNYITAEIYVNNSKQIDIQSAVYPTTATNAVNLHVTGSFFYSNYSTATQAVEVKLKLAYATGAITASASTSFNKNSRLIMTRIH